MTQIHEKLAELENIQSFFYDIYGIDLKIEFKTAEGTKSSFGLDIEKLLKNLEPEQNRTFFWAN